MQLYLIFDHVFWASEKIFDKIMHLSYVKTVQVNHFILSFHDVY